MQKRRIAWTLTANLISETVNKIVPLLTLHLASTRLGIDGFGSSQFALWILEIAILMVAFGYPQSLPLMLRQSKSLTEKQKIIAAVTANRLVQGLGVLGATAILLFTVPGWHKYAPAVLSSSFILLTSAIELTGVLVAVQKSVFISVPMITGKLASLVAIWWFVQNSADTVAYVVITSAANAVVGASTFVLGWKLLGIRQPDVKEMVQAFRTAAPFAGAGILLVALERFDLAIVEHHLGTTGAGWYSGPTRLLLSITPLAATISSVFYSEMLAVFDPHEIRRHFRFAVLATMAIMLPITTGAWVVGPGALALVFGTPFSAQGEVLSVLILSSIAHGIIVICGFQMLALHQKIAPLVTALAVGLLAGIMTGIPATGIWGLEGAAWANVTGRWLTALIVVSSALRMTPIQLSDLTTPIVKTGIPAVVMMIILQEWIKSSGTFKVEDPVQLAGIVAAGTLIYAIIFAIANRREAVIIWRRLRGLP